MTRVLWPWPNGLDDTSLGAPDEAIAPAIALIVVGLVLVIVVNELALRIERHAATSVADEAAAS